MGSKKAIILTSILGILLTLTIMLLGLWIGQGRMLDALEGIVSNNTWGIITLLILLSLAMSIGLPRQVAAFSAGYFIGWQLGFFVALLSAIIGCLMTFFCARYFFYKNVTSLFPKQSKKLVVFFSHDTFIKALIIRLIPAGSNFLTNVIAGSVKAPYRPYLLGTFVGFMPQMLIFSLLGNGIKLGQSTQIGVSIVLIILAGILSLYLVRKAKKAKLIVSDDS